MLKFIINELENQIAATNKQTKRIEGKKNTKHIKKIYSIQMQRF